MQQEVPAAADIADGRKAPRLDPTSWAESRRQKIERAALRRLGLHSAPGGRLAASGSRESRLSCGSPGGVNISPLSGRREQLLAQAPAAVGPARTAPGVLPSAPPLLATPRQGEAAKLPTQRLPLQTVQVQLQPMPQLAPQGGREIAPVNDAPRALPSRRRSQTAATAGLAISCGTSSSAAQSNPEAYPVETTISSAELFSWPLTSLAANVNMGGAATAHEREDLAELFQQALAAGACGGIVDELRSHQHEREQGVNEELAASGGADMSVPQDAFATPSSRVSEVASPRSSSSPTKRASPRRAREEPALPWPSASEPSVASKPPQGHEVTAEPASPTFVRASKTPRSDLAGVTKVSTASKPFCSSRPTSSEVVYESKARTTRSHLSRVDIGAVDLKWEQTPVVTTACSYAISPKLSPRCDVNVGVQADSDDELACISTFKGTFKGPPFDVDVHPLLFNPNRHSKKGTIRFAPQPRARSDLGSAMQPTSVDDNSRARADEKDSSSSRTRISDKVVVAGGKQSPRSDEALRDKDDKSLEQSPCSEDFGSWARIGDKAAICDKMPEALRRRLDAREKQRLVQKTALSPKEKEDTRGLTFQEACPEHKQNIALPAGRSLCSPRPECKDQYHKHRATSQPLVDEVTDVGKKKFINAGEKKVSRAQSQITKTSEADPEDGERCGRQMFDKNTLRLNHRDMFSSFIQQYRQEKKLLRVDFERRQPTVGNDDSLLRVYMRKRPLFEKEVRVLGEYDVLSIVPDPTTVPTRVILHNCLFQADLKTPFLHHLTYKFDEVFGETVSNEVVYYAAAAELIHSALQGGIGTMFMFGQTGSGKTYTMSYIQECASRDLFSGHSGEEPLLAVQFVELRGNRCFDLLACGPEDFRKNTQPELRLREQSDGSYTAEGAIDYYPRNQQELLTIMKVAQSRRSTSATDANAVSSRSHAVCLIRIFKSEGRLMLVDCAGSERRKDSRYHTKDRQQESAEINASLHALKECVRYLVTQQRVPSHAYRASSLTKVLADSFIRCGEARLAAICTASPCTTDTDHTIATLRMGMALGGWGNEHEEKQLLCDFLEAQRKPRLVHPKQWTPEQVGEWIRSTGGGQFRDVADALPSNFTGQMLVRLTETRCVQLCNGNDRRGRTLFDLLHQEIQRAGRSAN